MPSSIQNDDCRPSLSASHISFKQAFQFWLKLGCIGFGGPAGQIAIMHEELVQKRRWISDNRFVHALNYCMLLPGPEAQQLATYLGWLFHRHVGGVVAGSLFVLPSLVLLIGLSWLYLAYGHLSLVSGAFYGIKPVVVAIVLQACVRIGRRTLSNALLWGLAVFSLIGLFVLNLPFPLIVGVAAATGAIAQRIAPNLVSAKTNVHTAAARVGPAIIDDETPRASHTVWKLSRCVWVLTVGLLCWFLPFAALFALFGELHPFTQMAWFFTKAALLTFGGAYAVLPYVYQGAVAQFAWLSSSQMMDGLALGETTPGPLIMVVAFVGYVAGYTKVSLVGGSPFIAGALAACIVTWFTFLPSFVFVLAGGPLIESTHRDLRFTAPLRAISATVVGVIASLALFFARQVLWPMGLGGPLDGFALLLACIGALALLRFQRSVIEVVCSAALIGAVRAFMF